MNKDNFADIEYSKKLAWLWPANSPQSPYFWWVEDDRKDGVGIFNIYPKGTSPWPWSGHHYPAITTDMALSVLPKLFEVRNIPNKGDEWEVFIQITHSRMVMGDLGGWL